MTACGQGGGEEVEGVCGGGWRVGRLRGRNTTSPSGKAGEGGGGSGRRVWGLGGV